MSKHHRSRPSTAATAFLLCLLLGASAIVTIILGAIMVSLVRTATGL